MTALPTFGTEANALQVDVNNQQVAAAASATAASTSASNASSSATAAASSASGASTSASNASTSATAASTSASGASTSASNAATSATNAANSATAAASSAQGLIATSTTSLAIATGSKSFTTQSGKQFSAGIPIIAVDSSNANNFMFGTVSSYSSTTLVISVTSIGGSGTIASWNISVAGVQGIQGTQGPAGTPSLPRVTRTSNTMLGVSDLGKFFDITSGTFTQTFDAATTLTSGWWCYIRNSGTGDITLDPNASETIDGLTSYIMYPGECRLVQCSGTLFTSVCGLSCGECL